MNVNYINHSNHEKTGSNPNFRNKNRNNFNMLLLILFLFFSIFFIFSFFSNRTQYQLVCNHLTNEDSVLIISNLVKMKIPYRYILSAGEILVPKNQMYPVQLMLLSEGLPKKKGVGFELLDQEKFGISSFNIQLNYQRALEGELERSIQKIYAIKTATVHLAFPKKSTFLRSNLLPSASVIISFKKGKYLNFEQCKAITDVISASVPELLPNNVVIVDEYGNYLNKNNKFIFDSEYFKRNTIKYIEQDCYQRIIHVLQPILKLKNFSLQVKITKHYNINSDKNNFHFDHYKKLIFKNLHHVSSSILFKENTHISLTGDSVQYKASILLLMHCTKNTKNQLLPLDVSSIEYIRNIIVNVLHYLNIECTSVKVVNTHFLNNGNIVTPYYYFFYYLTSIPRYLLSIIIIFLILVVFRVFYVFSSKNVHTSHNKSLDHADINLPLLKDKRIFNKVENSTKKLKNIFQNTKFIKDIKNIAKNNPKLFAIIIQHWINKKK
ncbi:Flagellar M-ring protein [Buchnera aphidicola (Takecallis arundicolens)]|uniref:flagellar basal-body MS-ring/collar protein FliF n=1 Tax=Buchnera aphidicola TaxID=9 RepID=UPI003463A196